MIKYYPSSRVRTNLKTYGSEFTLNGRPYSGDYYETFDGKAYTGANPVVGKNEKLRPISLLNNIADPQKITSSRKLLSNIVNSTKTKTARQVSSPVPYYPFPIEADYSKGYITRYFLKKENDKGYVMEISEEEYANITNGTANYDISRYQTAKIIWKLTGPLKNTRISQYDTRAGIIDTNQRLVEQLDKTFLGIKAFIGGEYDKFARPTS